MRTLELIFEYLDHCYPFWQSLLRDKNNPDSLPPGWDIHYNLSMNYLRELAKRAADLLIDDKDPYICKLTLVGSRSVDINFAKHLQKQTLTTNNKNN